MTDKAFRRWAARALLLLIGVYSALAAYSRHLDFFYLIGGILLPWFFAWLGGEIERNKEQP